MFKFKQRRADATFLFDLLSHCVDNDVPQGLQVRYVTDNTVKACNAQRDRLIQSVHCNDDLLNCFQYRSNGLQYAGMN